VPKLKQWVYQYRDPLKLFMEKALNEIPYFKDADIGLQHEILYNFKKITFEKNGFIFKVDEVSE
jgi:hypothetical protein